MVRRTVPCRRCGNVYNIDVIFDVAKLFFQCFDDQFADDVFLLFVFPRIGVSEILPVFKPFGFDHYNAGCLSLRSHSGIKGK